MWVFLVGASIIFELFQDNHAVAFNRGSFPKSKWLMFDPEFLRRLHLQMEQIQKSFTFSTRLQNQLNEIARIGQQHAEQINMVKRLYSSVYIPQIDFPRLTIPNIEVPRIEIGTIDIPTIDISQFLAAIDVADKIIDTVGSSLQWQSHFDDQLRQIAKQHNDVINSLAVDFAALNLANNLLPFSRILRNLARLVGESEDLANAFNSARWSVAPSMDYNLKNRVVELFQEDKSRYISNAILGYYHRKDFENMVVMVDSWRNHQLFKSRIHIIDDALAAHQNKQFTLSVPALLPLIEGILNEYVAVHNLAARCGKIKKVYKAVLGEADDYTLSSRAVVLTILYQLENNTYADTDFKTELQRSMQRRQISRHTVLHGVSTNYNTSATSLRIFVLLDAISALHSQISTNHSH